MTILDSLEECARAWEPNTCLLGNVTARDIFWVVADLRAHRTEVKRLRARLAEMNEPWVSRRAYDEMALRAGGAEAERDGALAGVARLTVERDAAVARAEKAERYCARLFDNGRGWLFGDAMALADIEAMRARVKP